MLAYHYEPVQHLQEVVTGDGSLHLDDVGGLGELMCDRQKLQYSPARSLIERELSNPRKIRELRMQAIPGGGRGIIASSFAETGSHP